MKKLINDPADVLADALRGIEAASADLRVDHEHRVIYRARPKESGKVALVSGGGSGHEPLHGGFVGAGMLDAACAGEVFTSPTPDQVVAATVDVDRGAGVLHIVKNYTGDVMNFEMAGELAGASSGTRVETVVVDDDVAVEDSTWTAGRRGVGLTVLLEKIVGAAAEEGRDLDAVLSSPGASTAAGRSMGMALTSCTVPAAGKPTFDLPEDQMEMGVGIHGEPGRHRVPLGTAAEVAEQLVEPVLGRRRLHRWSQHRDAQRHGRHAPHRALPPVRRGRDPAREGRGRAGPGAGRQLHHLPRHGRRLRHGAAGRRRAAAPVGCSCPDSGAAMGGLTVTDVVTLDQLVSWLGSFTDAVHEQKGYLTELDSAIGDADHGANLTRGMDAVMAAVTGPDVARADDAGALLAKVGMTLVTSVGGASGPLYGTFFLRLGTAVGDATELDGPALLAALQAGLEGIVTRGRAEPGDKTMYDALAPAVAALAASLDRGESLPAALRLAATAAEEGRDATSEMLALKGRASYLGERSVGHIDPGSASSALMLTALADAVG